MNRFVKTVPSCIGNGLSSRRFIFISDFDSSETGPDSTIGTFPDDADARDFLLDLEARCFEARVAARFERMFMAVYYDANEEKIIEICQSMLSRTKGQ